MANFYRDNPDLQFYVQRMIDWPQLVDLMEPVLPAADPGGPTTAAEAADGYREAVDLVGQFAADRVAPHAAALDRAGLTLRDGRVAMPPALHGIFAGIAELGLYGLCVPRGLGGMNAPTLVYFLTSELFARADVSIMTHYGFHGAIAAALTLFSATEGSASYDPDTGAMTGSRFDAEVGEIVRGAAWGSMDITEPNAGSDMAALACRARLGEDGGWRVDGEKIFITSGHGKFHLVVARSEADVGGLQGLSLFLVAATSSDPAGAGRVHARVERLEDKLGHHASATCSVHFTDAPAKLIGKRGEGFRNMLLLMNNARLGVGFEALGLCEAAYRLARDYAAQRRSMGRHLDRHEIIADYLDQMRTDIQGLRALCVDGAVEEEMALRLKLRHFSGIDRDPGRRRQTQGRQRAAARRARQITPLVKFLAGEKAVAMARRALQILGGVGYTRDYGAEKLVRDSLVIPIYEGTSQIQALTATKEVLQQVLRSPQIFVRRVAQARWRGISARDPLERRVARLRTVELAALQHIVTRTATGKIRTLGEMPLARWPAALAGTTWNPRRDFALAMLHAERLTELMAESAIARSVWRQARQHPERRELLERILERCEPRCRFLHDEIISTGSRLLATLQADEATAQPGREPAARASLAS